MSEQNKRISKRGLVKAYIDWVFCSICLMNFERMMAPSLVRMVGRVREELYPGDPEVQKELMERHEVFFNTEPYFGAVVPGIVLGMEAEKASGGDISGELINNIKTALMGPFAGIGDSLLMGMLQPILLSIALGLCANGEIIGPLFYVVALLGIMFPCSWLLFQYGYKAGTNAAHHILAGGLKDRITQAAGVVGLVVVGAITASYTSVNLGLVYQQGEMQLSLADSISSMMMPKLPVLLMAFLSYYLMVIRKWSVQKMMILLLAVSVLGYFTTVLAV